MRMTALQARHSRLDRHNLFGPGRQQQQGWSAGASRCRRAPLRLPPSHPAGVVKVKDVLALARAAGVAAHASRVEDVWVGLHAPQPRVDLAHLALGGGVGRGRDWAG